MSDSDASIEALVISLATSAAIHFGDVPESISGQRQERNLPAAKQMIDLLSVLEAKTQGNLTAEEGQLLQQVLYDVRMRFVQLATETETQKKIILP